MGTTQIPPFEGKKLEMDALNELDEAVQTVTREIRDMWWERQAEIVSWEK